MVSTNGLAQRCVPTRSLRLCVKGNATFDCIAPAKSTAVQPLRDLGAAGFGRSAYSRRSLAGICTAVSAQESQTFVPRLQFQVM